MEDTQHGPGGQCVLTHAVKEWGLDHDIAQIPNHYTVEQTVIDLGTVLKKNDAL